MRTPASIFRYRIHPMLIVFPIGLWIFSLACDLIRLAGASGETWTTVAFFSMIGGLIGALIVMREYGFTAENVCKRALAVLG
jgi:uncharacterized membrane protein